MIAVVEATPSEIDALVDLEAALFLEDAGRYDPFSDPTWPEREGRKDFEDLISSPDGILLAARISDEVVGLLAGYATKASPTRQPLQKVRCSLEVCETDQLLFFQILHVPNLCVGGCPTMFDIASGVSHVRPLRIRHSAHRRPYMT